MKAKGEPDDDKRLIIKLFAGNYARDLISKTINITQTR
jgi:hypothetical protein